MQQKAERARSKIEPPSVELKREREKFVRMFETEKG